jgi:hypothetical protein
MMYENEKADSEVVQSRLFCDPNGTCFVDDSLRYFKHTKARATIITFGDACVAECELVKDDCYLELGFHIFGPDLMRFKPNNDDAIIDRNKMIITLHREGNSLREIASNVGCSRPPVNRALMQSTSSMLNQKIICATSADNNTIHIRKSQPA